MEWIIGGVNMPLPDAKPDKRIYELLKTVDLENLSFADFQGVAKTIYAEQGAEDELRRIVLVNLARLSVKGNWDGLTTGGGGGGPGMVYASPNGDYKSGDLDFQNIANNGWASSQATTNTDMSSGRQFWRPFVAAMDGDLTGIRINVAVAGTSTPEVKVGIYNAADDGNPSDLIGSATFDTSSTGGKLVTSFSSTITLERGKLYWYCVVQTGGTGTQLNAQNALYSGALYLSNAHAANSWVVVNKVDTGVLSDPAALSNMEDGGGNHPPINVGIGWL